MHWQKAPEFPGDAKIKVLRGDRARKSRTLLVRLDPGRRVYPHSHIGTVQHYVIDGEYQCEGESYGAGTYRLLPEHTDVGEITTRDGATVLMIYDPVI
jgi:hypothetical protein